MQGLELPIITSFGQLALILAGVGLGYRFRKILFTNHAPTGEAGMAELRAQVETVAKDAREHRDKIMQNMDDTRHMLATPLTSLNLNLALMQQTMTEIRDRLPLRRGDG